MKRTFIAIRADAGENLRAVISEIRNELKNESIRWVDIDNMHITIAFLGDTTEEDVNKVSGMLQKTCSATGGFSFRLSGIGIFRNIHDPRVIWAGIEKSEELDGLNSIVKTGLAGIGIKTGERDFTPHLTLGRIKGIKEKKTLENLLSRYRSAVFQDVHISELIFFESRLSQTGPAYFPISTITL